MRYSQQGCRNSDRVLERIVLFGLCGLLIGLGGCQSLLPTQATEGSKLEHFADAQALYDKVAVDQSDLEALHELDILTGRNGTVMILSAIDVAKEFHAFGALYPQGIPDWLTSCLAAADGCKGYRWEMIVERRKRIGNFWADFLYFRRDTEVTRWRFSALFVLQDDIVRYKTWSGDPESVRMEYNRNPLGPLQGLGERAGAFVGP